MTITKTIITLAALALALVTAPVSADALTIDDAVQSALKNNSLIGSARATTDAARYRARASLAGFLPQATANYSWTQSTEPTLMGTDELSVASGTVSLNVFSGFANVNTTQAAKASYKAAEYGERATVADVVLSVETAYIEVLKARQNVEVTDEAVVLLENQLRDVTLSYREGVVARNEVLKVEVELANARLTASTARSGLKVAVQELSRLIGMNITEPDTLADLPVRAGKELDTDALIQKMLMKRSDLERLRKNREALENSRAARMGGALPRVDVSMTQLSYGEDATPSGRAGIESETQTAVSVSWQLFSGLERYHTVKAERYDILALSHQIVNAERTMTVQLQNAVESYRLARTNLGVAEKGVQQAEENYRIVENQFRQRIATNTDLLDAQVLLSRARTDFINAFYQLYSSMSTIERLVETPVFMD